MTETHKSNRPKAPLTRKKKILFVAAVLGVLLVLVFLSTLEIPSPSDTDADETAFTPVTHPPQNFYDPPEGDIFTLPEYLALDRTIEYTFGGESHEISETWLPDSPFDRFFLSYFSALQQGFSGGDTQSGFNAFYSAVYFRRNSPFLAFSPQMVYDIEVERLTDPQTITAADTEEDAAYLGCTLTTFAVRYKIFRNDGSFRRDIVDEDVLPQIVTLLTDKSGRVTINAVSYYQIQGGPADKEDESLLPYILPLVWLVLVLVALVLLLLLRKKFLLAPLLSSAAAFLLSLRFSAAIQLSVFFPLLALMLALFFFLAVRKKKKNDSAEKGGQGEDKAGKEPVEADNANGSGDGGDNDGGDNSDGDNSDGDNSDGDNSGGDNSDGDNSDDKTSASDLGGSADAADREGRGEAGKDTTSSDGE